MNKVFLIGNLTRDPELTETSGGIKICRFAIAVNVTIQTQTENGRRISLTVLLGADLLKRFQDIRTKAIKSL